MIIEKQGKQKSEQLGLLSYQFERLLDHYNAHYMDAEPIDNRFDYIIDLVDGALLVGFVEDLSELKGFRLKGKDMKQLNGVFIDKNGNTKCFFWNEKEKINVFRIMSYGVDRYVGQKVDEYSVKLDEIIKDAYEYSKNVVGEVK